MSARKIAPLVAPRATSKTDAARRVEIQIEEGSDEVKTIVGRKIKIIVAKKGKSERCMVESARRHTSNDETLAALARGRIKFKQPSEYFCVN